MLIQQFESVQRRLWKRIIKRKWRLLIFFILIHGLVIYNIRNNVKLENRTGNVLVQDSILHLTHVKIYSHYHAQKETKSSKTLMLTTMDSGSTANKHRRNLVTGKHRDLTSVSESIDLVHDSGVNAGGIKAIRLNEEEVLNRVERWFFIQNKSEKDSLLNKHEFTFPLNSQLCAQNIDILIFVHSAAANVHRREAIRQTWGSVEKYKNLSLVTLFILGQTLDPVLTQNLITESLKYGDMVQGNFLDTYRNLTYKHVMALHWITSQCKDVRTVVKVDDDVVIHIYKLINFSKHFGHIHNKLYCSYFSREGPIRNEGDKWYTPKEIYPFELYPRYCEGMAYVLSVDEVRRLCKASEDTRFYWVDDVYVTGILARKAGIGHAQLKPDHQYVKKGRSFNSQFTNILFYLEYDNVYDIWNDIDTKRHIYD